MRPVNLTDIPFIIACLQKLRIESPIYAECADDPVYVTETLTAMIQSEGFLGVIVEGKGFMIGMVSAQWYSSIQNAYEQLIYVLPEHRKSSAAYRLVTGFIDAAYAYGAAFAYAGASTGLDHEGTFRMYERLGFERFGTGVRKELL